MPYDDFANDFEEADDHGTPAPTREAAYLDAQGNLHGDLSFTDADFHAILAPVRHQARPVRKRGPVDVLYTWPGGAHLDVQDFFREPREGDEVVVVVRPGARGLWRFVVAARAAWKVLQI